MELKQHESSAMRLEDYFKHVIKQFNNSIKHRPIVYWFIDENRLVDVGLANSISSSRYSYVCSFSSEMVRLYDQFLLECKVINLRYEKVKKLWNTLTAKQKEALMTMKEWEKESHLGITGGLFHMVMGSGKSLLMLYKSSIRMQPFPSLIVVNASNVKTIVKEAGKWYPNANILICHNDFSKVWTTYLNPKMFSSMSAFDFVVISHQTLSSHYKKFHIKSVLTERGTFETCGPRQGVSFLKRCNLEESRHSLFYGNVWDNIFFDESQNIRNPKSLGAAAAIALHANSYYCMTGTPNVNANEDIITQMVFLGYDHAAVDKKQNYMELFLPRIFQSNKIENLDVPKYTFDYWVNLLPKEQQIYSSFLHRINEEYKVFERFQEGWAQILVIIVKLRIAAISSHNITMFDNGEMTSANILLHQAGFDQEYVQSEESKYGAKVQALLKLLKIFPKDWKILLYSEFIEPLKVAAEVCNKAGYPSAHIDSKMGKSKQKDILNDFENNPEFKLLGMNIKTGSTGFNFQFANVVIFFESWWNESVERQAEARCWRKGQTKPVYVVHMETKDSIENYVVQVKREKQSKIEQAWNSHISSGGHTKTAIIDHLSARFNKVKSFDKTHEITESLADGQKINTFVSNRWLDELREIERDFEEGKFSEAAVDTLIKFGYMYMLNKYDLYAWKIYKHLYPDKSYQDFLDCIDSE